MNPTDEPGALQRPQRRIHGLLLSRPLAVFDLETTGVSPAGDRIIEITVIRLALDGSETVLHQRLNPEVTIPSDATAVHGITDEDVAGEPAFATVAADHIAIVTAKVK